MAINMSYCKFENTLRALKQCAEEWNDVESNTEIKAKKKMIELMADLLTEEGYEVTKDQD